MHGKRMIASMKDHIIKLGKSNLNIAQKMEGVKFMELPRIDYRMMRADLKKSDLGVSMFGYGARSRVGFECVGFPKGWQACHGGTVDSRSLPFKTARIRG
jgi:hypothetical protein